jgi:DNA invertase Pin-like site-specific DNA recombinase
MRTIIYCRKSTNESWKQEQSIETQMTWCQKYCEDNKMDVVDVIVELQSASKLWRWWFEKLIDMFENWQAEYLVAHHIDRISRNPIDEWNIKWLAQQKKIKEIHSSEWIFNWQQILLLSLHLAMANQYTNDLSQKIKEWISTKLKNWWVVWATPLWYINNRETKQAEVDNEVAFLIKKVFELRSKWHSIRDITKRVNDLWLKTKQTRTRIPKKVSKSTIEIILKNPFYYWIIQHSWEFYEWNHKPIVSKALYDRANNINRWIIYVQNRDLTPLKWVVKHFDTQSILCTSLIKNKYIYFHLHARKWKFWINQSEIIKHFDENIHLYNIPDQYKWDIRKWLEERYTGKLKEGKDQKKILNKKITELENEKPWLIQMRSRWELDSEEFAIEKNRIIEEVANLKFELSKLDDQDNVILDDLDNSVELYVDLLRKRKSYNEYQKALIISKILVELFVDDKKRLYIEEKPLYKTLRTVNFMLNSELEVATVQWSNFINELFENWKNFIDTVKTLKPLLN